MKKLTIVLILIVCLFIFANCTTQTISETSTQIEPESTSVVESITTKIEESTEVEETSQSPLETWTYVNPHDAATEGILETTEFDYTGSEETTEEPTQGEPVSEFVPHQNQIERTYRILMTAFITKDSDKILEAITNNKDVFLYIITHRTTYSFEQTPFANIYYPDQFAEGSFKNVIECNSFSGECTIIDFYGITVENVEVDGHTEMHVTDNHKQYKVYIFGPVDEEPFTLEEATIYITYTHYTYTETSWGPDDDNLYHMDYSPTYHVTGEKLLTIPYIDLKNLGAETNK